jgi:arginyl-tRNA synthetase
VLLICVYRYADLKINRLTNYTFNFDQMLSDKVDSLHTNFES